MILDYSSSLTSSLTIPFRPKGLQSRLEILRDNKVKLIVTKDTFSYDLMKLRIYPIYSQLWDSILTRCPEECVAESNVDVIKLVKEDHNRYYVNDITTTKFSIISKPSIIQTILKIFTVFFCSLTLI